MYIIVDGKLPPGAQAAQAVHAAFDIALEHPKATAKWHESNYVIVLSSDNLLVDAARVTDLGIPAVYVREYDLDNALTAVAFVPDPRVGIALSDLPLALRDAML